ncbi:hypothetical protein MUU46_20340 [Scandinavium sp. TWS1a]|uniref:hypothetical protein n=1 Tax=Scandinavium tedordense TaxID=2926521 RepID=UPI002165A92E|nr:hypothetical protein [Scandinavium tedordense]MCS2172636.1 hypothetical protein [Scandinavium tedordense]
MSIEIMKLTFLSYRLGIIGLIEYQERLEVYRCLIDSSSSVADPRNAPGEDYAFPEESRVHYEDEWDRNNRMKDSQ